ncbi:Cupin domain [Fusobacterium necrogenes]|uniref:Cupin domain n=1 Tax=Fusobacterium necrogenes TaxID=858 RepID=A0A377GWM6_9FUSO|nr:cupin domain-containing protein [Fusobacterium necrogenes]STO31369.1 Cupin domain [Fusobacterium necrogenes]
MEKIIKNIEISKSSSLKSQIEYKKDSIEQLILAKNQGVTMILFSFDRGKEIPSHIAPGDAFVNCLEGKGKIILNGVEHILNEGDYIVMPAKEPHSVYALEKFKMLLTIVI